MKNSNWEELVDAYVDNEISPQERELVESRLCDDAELKDAADWARRLGALLIETRVETPPEFTERLTATLNASDAWKRYGSEVSSRRAVAGSGRAKWIPGVVGASAAAIAVAAFGLAYSNLRSAPKPPVDSSREVVETTPVVPNRELQEPAPSRPPVQTPASEGVPLSHEERAASQTSLWSVVRLNDVAEHKKLNATIKAICAQYDVDYMKFDSNRELLIQQASPEMWRALQRALEASGEFEASGALRAWSEESAQNTARDVRVTIKIIESTKESE